jgi:hypothetical protein
LDVFDGPLNDLLHFGCVHGSGISDYRGQHEKYQFSDHNVTH